MNHAHEYDARVMPLRRQTLVVEEIGDELWISKAEGLTTGELGAEQVDAVGGDYGFKKYETLECPEESTLQIPLHSMSTVSVFYTSK
jgi:hypothetical protein